MWVLQQDVINFTDNHLWEILMDGQKAIYFFRALWYLCQFTWEEVEFLIDLFAAFSELDGVDKFSDKKKVDTLRVSIMKKLNLYSQTIDASPSLTTIFDSSFSIPQFTALIQTTIDQEIANKFWWVVKNLRTWTSRKVVQLLTKQKLENEWLINKLLKEGFKDPLIILDIRPSGIFWDLLNAGLAKLKMQLEVFDILDTESLDFFWNSEMKSFDDWAKKYVDTMVKNGKIPENMASRLTILIWLYTPPRAKEFYDHEVKMINAQLAKLKVLLSQTDDLSLRRNKKSIQNSIETLINLINNLEKNLFWVLAE